MPTVFGGLGFKANNRQERTVIKSISPARPLATMGANFGKRAMVVLMLSGSLLMFGDIDQIIANGSPMKDAQARVGRPLTPLSYAGAARRTTRRVVRRTYYCHGMTVYQPCY
jgi:hypothetical protein